MKRYQIDVDGRTFNVRLLGDPHQEQVEVEVDGLPLSVKVKALPPEEAEVAGAAPPAGKAPPASGAASNTVVAPLPGVVKSIVVRPGHQVARGDVLLVIEAMKMDNVIRATREGVIDAVHVAEGQRVAHGQPLLDFE